MNHKYKCDATVKLASKPHQATIETKDVDRIVVNPVVSAMKKAGSKYGGYEWALDTSTNRHITNDMTDYVPGTYKIRVAKVAVGSGKTESPGYGDVIISADGKRLRLRNVVFLKSCPIKLLAASPFVRGGCSIKIESDSLSITQGNTVILRGKEIGGLYGVDAKTQSVPSTIAKSFLLKCADGTIAAAEQLLLLHRGYGHLGWIKLRKLLGWEKNKGEDEPHCHECSIVKSAKSSLSKWHFKRSERPIHRIHMDVIFGKDSQWKAQVMVDDYTRRS